MKRGKRDKRGRKGRKRKETGEKGRERGKREKRKKRGKGQMGISMARWGLVWPGVGKGKWGEGGTKDEKGEKG